MSTDWTPDQALRADATGSQILQRYNRLKVTSYDHYPQVGGFLKEGNSPPPVQVAREFAAACVAAERERQTPSASVCYHACWRCGWELVTHADGQFYSHVCPKEPTP